MKKNSVTLLVCICLLASLAWCAVACGPVPSSCKCGKACICETCDDCPNDCAKGCKCQKK